MSLNSTVSSCSSGVAEPEMTELESLLNSVAKLQEGGHDKEVHAVYERQDRSEAEAIRSTAILAVQESSDSDSDYPIVVVPSNGTTSSHNVLFTADADSIVVPSIGTTSSHNVLSTSGADSIVVVPSNGITSNRNAINPPSTYNAKSSTTSNSNYCVLGSKLAELRRTADNRGLNVFFNDGEEEDEEDSSEKLITKGGSSRRGNPKQDMVRYLEKKAEVKFILRKKCVLKINKFQLQREIEVRKEEIGVRKEELKIRVKEVEIKAREVENKNKELDILLEKTKAEAENQKRITDLLLVLANRQ